VDTLIESASRAEQLPQIKQLSVSIARSTQGYKKTTKESQFHTVITTFGTFVMKTLFNITQYILV